MTKAVRKEITYTKYQFFQGRIEKINNGQRGFLPDTQKNAVELLGKEIPASVYEAVEPYKAFAIWLGSEINPLIDDDGHKMEIQVSASGKSYFFDDAKIDAAEENREITTSNFAAASAEINEEIAANKARGFIKFEVGKIYFGSAFANDKFQVINLDGDFVTVKQIDGTPGGTRRMKIRSDEFDNCEYVPFGSDFVDSRHEVVASNNATEDNRDAAEVDEEIDNIIAEEIKPSIDDELFAQADFINKEAELSVECAAACKYGDLTIEGKIVSLPDKKGRVRYYKYSWDNMRDYPCDTSLEPISEEEARNIAAQWHLAFSPMTFEEYMAASNAEYKKIRTIYIKEGGAIARQYDQDLADEIASADKLNSEIISCLDDYLVDTDAAAEVEIMNEILAHIDEYIIKPKVVTVTESGIKAAVSNYKAIGEHFDDIMDVAVDEGLPNWEREQEKLERRHYSAERKAKAKFVSDFFKTIGIPKELLKISVEKKVVVREGVKEIEVIYFEPKTEKINTDQLEKIAMYFENDYTDTDVVEFIDGYEGRFDVLDEDDAEIEIKILKESTPDDTPENTVEKNKAEKSVEEIDASEYAVSVEAQEVVVDAEFENAKNEEFNKVPKVDTQTNEKPTSKNFETIYIATTGVYNYKLENGDGLDDYYFKQKIHAAIKNGAKVKIRNGLTFYGWIDFSPCELQSVEVCDVYRMYELGDRIDKRIAAIIEYPNVAEKTLKEKVAEIKNRPHKSCIDWADAVFQNVTILEVFRLQREFKKLLKLGEVKRAAVVFENIQLYFRAA